MRALRNGVGDNVLHPKARSLNPPRIAPILSNGYSAPPDHVKYLVNRRYSCSHPDVEAME